MKATGLGLQFFWIRLLAYLLRNLVTGWRQWRQLESGIAFLQDYSMHSVYRSIITTTREIFLALDSTGNDVAHKRVFLWQVSGEVHFLPLESFSDSQSRKSKIWTYCGSFNKIEKAIWIKDKSYVNSIKLTLWIDVYAFWMLLLVVFLDPKYGAVPILIL